MPTTSHDPSATAKQIRTAGVQPLERTRGDEKKGPKGTEKGPKGTEEARRDTTAKQDEERSDWEGMTEKPEQGEDDIAAPGELPETD